MVSSLLLSELALSSMSSAHSFGFESRSIGWYIFCVENIYLIELYFGFQPRSNSFERILAFRLLENSVGFGIKVLRFGLILKQDIFLSKLN